MCGSDGELFIPGFLDIICTEVALCLLISLYCFVTDVVNLSGAVSGFFIGTALLKVNVCYFTALMLCLLGGSKVAGYKAEKKILVFGKDLRKGQKRHWITVSANFCIASCIAFHSLRKTNTSSGLVIDMSDSSSWFNLAVLGIISSSSGDYWSAMIGSVSQSQPRLITTWRKVPPGTNGAVNLAGFIASFVGGLVVGLGYYIGFISLSTLALQEAPPQWPIIFAGGVGGFLGSFIDSYLGALFEYSALSEKGQVVDMKQEHSNHISGMGFLDGKSITMLAGAINALLLPTLCQIFLP
ncbi:transmembrane protein 19-like [Anneissia japonica]|uniref:transmembrane protein 19-like n=1 Tax=Anneissia japonica TaxID=1529436 RepID=UPI001425AA67|nr:transmembrane protein 19-like [Anneissia japonica]